MKSLKIPFFPTLRPAHWIFAIVLLIRVVVLARLTGSPFLLPARGDMHFYDEWAQRILHGQMTDHFAFYGLPLYAYLLALIYGLVGYGPFVPGLLQAGLEAGTATIIYQLGRLVFSRPTGDVAGRAETDGLRPTDLRAEFIGIAAALGWAFFGPAQAYAVVLMPTVWFVFIFWLIIWMVVRSKNAPGYAKCLSYGLLIGFVSMGIATILFLLPLLIVAVLKRTNGSAHSRTGKIAAVALLFVGTGAGASPCWIHNYFIARDPVFLSAHSGVNYWIGNNALSNGYPRFPPGLRAGQQAMLADSIRAAENAAGRSLKRSEVSAYWSNKTADYIRNNFGTWLKLVGTKAKNFWSAFQYDDLSIVTSLREEGVIFPAIYFGLVAALAIPGMLLGWRFFPQSRWISAAVLLSMLSLLPVFVTERYRLAAGPGLMILAAFGLSFFWEASSANKFGLAATYVALLIVSTIFVAWPQKDPSLWALDAYNSGWQALESNNLQAAERKLNLAYAYVPTNPETNFALGNLHLARGDKARARSFYAATLRLDSNHLRAYNNLGVMALQEQNWDDAVSFFEKALVQDSRNAKTYYLLAQAHLKSGDIRSADAEISQALKLNSAPPEFHALQTEIEMARADKTNNQ